MARELPHASLIEGLRFTAQALVPNVVQGLFRRRRRAVAVATKLDADRHGAGVVGSLRRSHGPGPLWVRAASDEALLLLSRDDVRRALEGAPEPFAADPDAKRRGMSHFQPDALTISRGELWQNRRRFTEAVLDTGQPLHRLADRFRSVCGEEAASLLDDVGGAGGSLNWEPFNRAVRRVTRRVILGDGAAGDEEVSELLAELMDEANGLPKERSERFEPFVERIRAYVSEAEPGSLVGLFDEAPHDDETRVEGQVPHWMFALGDTLAVNVFRALALIVTHPAKRAKLERELEASDLQTAQGVGGLGYLEGCLQEAMRLWPTTPLLSRETVTDVEWDGDTVAAGKQVMIFNTFHHRDRETHDFADRFSPEEWTEGEAGEEWLFNHFSHGPQGCPGAGLALFVGKALLADLLTQGEFRLSGASLDPLRPLPYMLDFHRLRFVLEARR